MVTGLGELLPALELVAVVVVVVVAAGVLVVTEPVDAVLARVDFVELWAKATSPAITAHVATNSVTAPVATRRRIIRTRFALACLMLCGDSFTVATASRRTVAPALATGKKPL